MDKKELIDGYIDFISQNKTERECVTAFERLAKEAGYRNLLECDKLAAGDKVYYKRMGKAIVLFNIGTDDITEGLNILGSHLDCPRLDIKQNPFYEKDNLTYLNTHYYGGIKKYQWLTLPLALHGVVSLTSGENKKIVIGEEEGDIKFCITDILPHLAQEQMKKTAGEFVDGEDLDLLIGCSAYKEKSVDLTDNEDKDKDNKDKKDGALKAILKIIKEKYGITQEDFKSAELEVVPSGKACSMGFDSSLILGYGHDDRSCAYPSFISLVNSKNTSRTSCTLLVDKEEIGSVGSTGMASNFFEVALGEVLIRLKGSYSDLLIKRILASSMMLSSDVNAAYDPLNALVFDSDNSSRLGGGIVINKYTGSRGKSGASDANAEYLGYLRRIFKENAVHFQCSELGRVDKGGGGTIAYLCAKYGISTVDCGVPVMNMHAPHEVIAKDDLWDTYNGYCSFLKNTLNANTLY